MSEDSSELEFLDPIIPTNTSFSLLLPTLRTAWDSTSIGEGKFCWWKYKTTIIDGYEPRDTNVHFVFGIEYHHALEYYDHLKTEGHSHRESAEEVVSDLLQRTWDKNLRRPWPSEDPHKNRGTLSRSVLWYLAQFENDSLETLILDNGKP